jgi:four helix bundle protein
MGNRESFKRPHEGLEVWRDAMDLVVTVYRFSSVFPDSERFGLTAQIRRSAVSVPARAEYLRFLSISRGSLSELDTHAQIAERLGFAERPQALREGVDRCFAKLTALMNSLDPRGSR